MKFGFLLNKYMDIILKKKKENVFQIVYMGFMRDGGSYLFIGIWILFIQEYQIFLGRRQFLLLRVVGCEKMQYFVEFGRGESIVFNRYQVLLNVFYFIV